MKVTEGGQGSGKAKHLEARTSADGVQVAMASAGYLSPMLNDSKIDTRRSRPVNASVPANAPPAAPSIMASTQHPDPAARQPLLRKLRYMSVQR